MRVERFSCETQLEAQVKRAPRKLACLQNLRETLTNVIQELAFYNADMDFWQNLIKLKNELINIENTNAVILKESKIFKTENFIDRLAVHLPFNFTFLTKTQLTYTYPFNSNVINSFSKSFIYPFIHLFIHSFIHYWSHH